MDFDYSCSTVVVNVEDFPEVCRSCLLKCDPKSIFKITYKDLSFCKIIETCTSVRVVEGDGLPENICTACMNLLVIFFEFAQKCQRSSDLLKKVLTEKGFQKQNEIDTVVDCFEKANEVEEIVIKVEEDHQIETVSELVKECENGKDSEETNSKNVGGLSKKGNTYNKSDEQFTSTNKPTMHTGMAGHKKPINYICEICGKSFLHKSLLQDHIRTHVKERNRVCPFCGIGFSSSCNLNTHLKIHIQEKPHVCKICGKGFIQNRTYLMHLRTHTRELPFLCSYCGEGFSSLSDHVSHERRHESKNVVFGIKQQKRPIEEHTFKIQFVVE